MMSIKLLSAGLLVLFVRGQMTAGSWTPQEMVAAHNLYRAQVGVPSLRWSSSLAARAQQWANTLIQRRTFTPRRDGVFGENLFEVAGGEATPAEVVKAWDSEKANYHYDSNSCSARCGHYTQVVWRDTKEVGCGVVVVGGGLAGLAASIHLARAGLQVACFEPVTQFKAIVGESLDWSAPELFRQLGLRMDEMVREEISTYKRHVALKLNEEAKIEYVPPPWLGEPPLNIELRTLHLDRVKVHERVARIADEWGVTMIRERVTHAERAGKTLAAVHTENGRRVEAQWFVDASGSAASFLGREFQLPSIEYGPKKVAVWTHFKVSDGPEATTLYADPEAGQYMEWIWEIPINPDTVSVGLVATGETMKRRREAKLSVHDIYQQQLMKFDRFKHLAHSAKADALHVTSFTCRTFQRVCGPNWIIIGEAASMVDPITGNGVTAALRHAAEGAVLIRRFRHKGRISAWAQATYTCACGR